MAHLYKRAVVNELGVNVKHIGMVYMLYGK